MIEQEDGRVAGSIDRARVAELLAATDDDEMQAYYREILGESEKGKGSEDVPAEDIEFTEPDAAKVVQADLEQADLDALRAQAEELGVKVDGRWGADRLREEIAAYEGEGDG